MGRLLLFEPSSTSIVACMDTGGRKEAHGHRAAGSFDVLLLHVHLSLLVFSAAVNPSRGMVARTDLMTKMLRTPRRCLRCCTPVPRVRASPETAADGRDGSERERNTDIKATRATMPPTHFAWVSKPSE